MKRSILLLFLVIIFSSPLFAQELPISELGVEQFIELLKLDREPDLESYYLWNGTIEKIIKRDGHLELTIVKARWEDSRRIISFKTTLLVKRPEQIKMILDLKKYSKIVYIARIIKLNELHPICEAVKIYKN